MDTCKAKDIDPVWSNRHQCDKPKGHEDEQHECGCGHTW